jgi:hypothetical protein
MTAAGGAWSRPRGARRGVADLVVGGLLCATPVTAVIALGWIARKTGGARPGWILGPRGSGAAGRLLGGLAANIRTGVMTLAGLLAWTLPFTLIWLLAWWAGWENSFNKGYEQAWVGPTLFIAATLLSLPALTLLPHAAAHAALEGRLSAFFELRRILGRARAAGWRGLGLALLSVLAALPLFAFTALPAFVEGFLPAFAALPLEQQVEAGQMIGLAAALYSFAALWFLRHRAVRIARRAPAARRLAPVWLALSALAWAALPVLILVAQFVNYAPHRWLTHPLMLLPWPG